MKTLITGSLMVLASMSFAENKKVCLNLTEMSFASQDSLKQDKEILEVFRRYLNYSISHEDGFESSVDQCDETLRVELYATSGAWTAFAKYSGTAREEMVDRLYPEEIKHFSQRVVNSLVRDKSFNESLNRNNVISADSKLKPAKVKGEIQTSFAIGSSLRTSQFQSKERGKLGSETIYYTPTIVKIGSKYRYDQWAVATQLGGAINPNLNSLLSEDKSGEVRFSHEVGVGLQFLYSPNVNSLKGAYTGVGGTFNVQTFKAFGLYTDQFLYAGGMNLDLVAGYEMFRVSTAGFFIQSELNLPTYIAQGRKVNGYVNTWTPGVSLITGVNF